MTLQYRSTILGLIATIILSGCTPALSLSTSTPTATIQVSASPIPTTTSLPATVPPLPTATSTSTPNATPLSLTQGTTFVFISETIPDGTNFLPGQTFKKTWTLKNGSTLTWNKNFFLIRTSSSPANETLGSPDKIPLPQEVNPGETLQIGVDLVAPKQNGQYTVFYQLQDSSGSLVPNSQIWVTIMVGNIPLTGGTNTVSGVTATLTSFMNDAQNTTVDFCMTVDFHKYTLDIAPVLLIDQKAAPFLTGSSDFPSGSGCLEMVYQLNASEIEQAQQIILSIEGSLRMAPPPGDPDVACRTARLNLIAAYPGLDFECHFSMAGYYTDLQLPDGLTRDQANTLVVNAIEGAIYGPWTLTIK